MLIKKIFIAYYKVIMLKKHALLLLVNFISFALYAQQNMIKKYLLLIIRLLC